MEGYATEEQQVEALKSWWKSNGNAVIFGTVLGLAGLVGFRYYNASQLTSQEELSAAYDTVVTELSENGLAAKATTQTFIDTNSGNAYATLTALQLAAEAVKKQDFAEAETQLSWVATNSNQASILPIAKLRLARVQAQLANFDDALATLDKITLDTFASKKAEVQGDIYVQQGDLNAARSAYETALAGIGANTQLLQLKLDDLAVVDVADDLDAAIAGELNEQ
ncbi:tetratricopeptide repeat protein [Moritella marina ATCC 15381]|uniref:Ancillary SecYEG translocon subunit n=1 Tax=Moritella marina ATCC 15381 TaxID=1202962 RepID=A0A5J6WLK9_MORMI|nr:tetratricopeptide repeat protein [Moritella marina]QFI38937.1 tetratricopeptide repeat protein [Moritella marina ATCC 15381]